MNQQYYTNEQQRSLSSTTQMQYSSSAQYQQYPQGHPSASSSYASQQYYAQPDTQQLAYAAQQNYAQVPSSHTMVNSASYPGAAGQQAAPMAYNPRSMSAPGGHTVYPDQSQAAHYAQYPSQAQYSQQAMQQQHQQHVHSLSPRYPPAQALHQHEQSLRRHSGSPSSVSPTMQYAAHPHSSSQPYPSSSSHHGQLPPSPGTERFPCDKCDKTFSRSHDRKRHYESQHSSQPTSHRCPYCRKEFSRADSMKRHVDNGCEKDPTYACT